MERPTPLRTLLAAALAGLLALAGCGYDDDGEQSVGGAGSPASVTSGYPPTSFDELAAIFDPQLEPLGLRLTRGLLIDRSDGGYIPSAEGEHLALYVEPIDDGEYDTADFVEGLTTVTALVTPQVFERWPAIETYDICQEPPTEIDPRPEPAPYTQIEMGRDTAESVDWDEVSLESVLRLEQETDTRLIITQVIRDDPGFKAAQEAALS